MLRRCLTILLFCVFILPGVIAADDTGLTLSTHIRENLFKHELPDAFILRYKPDGDVADTIRTLGYGRDIDLPHGYSSMVIFSLPHRDTVITVDVCAPGYETQSVTWEIAGLGKREQYRELPEVLLRKAKVLKEVTVTATKVKFYNKGDTVVYNADAFQLAEGSMLDALIAQLPGAKINENGQISINGEFVETLLLNGKEFFKGNEKMMLENIGAYTVRQIEVYKGQTDEEKWLGGPEPPKHLTMDVKLKKEYSNGWLINSQAGYGTADRYLAKLFASWYSARSNVTFVGNLNNLNDTRQPGQSDSWSPDKMPSGRRTTRCAGVNYSHDSGSGDFKLTGHLGYQGAVNDTYSSTSRTNFLPSGNTFDRSFTSGKAESWTLSTYNDLSLTKGKSRRLGLLASGSMGRVDSRSSALSGTFDTDHSDMTMQALENIYGSAAPGVVESVINRSASRYMGVTRTEDFKVSPVFSLKLPNSNDALVFNLGVAFNRSRNEAWDDYNVNFGTDPTPSQVRRNFTRLSPDRDLTLSASAGYHCLITKSLSFYINYRFAFRNADKSSSMYALDRLADMGVFGEVPLGYAAAFDPGNSYGSTTRNAGHQISVMAFWTRTFDSSIFMARLSPMLCISHDRMDYNRAARPYFIRRNSLAWSPQPVAEIAWWGGRYDDTRSYAHSLNYSLTLDSRSPDLLLLVDVVNDADPLNLQLGNPGLKNSFEMRHSLEWEFRPRHRPVNNTLRLSYSSTADALVRGYTYDTSTGIRCNRTYNVGGNSLMQAVDFFNWEFGSSKQFLFSSATDVARSTDADMIGISQSQPTKTTVTNLNLGEDLILTCKIGCQQLSAQTTLSRRHASSPREGFNVIDALHCKYGLSGTFVLPAGFGISTDFNLYKRSGYGVRELDTTDAVWNLRLSYTPKGSRWVFSADGFDLLHRLSNVHYAVTAAGRTVSYSNTLPRYFILTVQYRLHLKPKK